MVNGTTPKPERFEVRKSAPSHPFIVMEALSYFMLRAVEGQFVKGLKAEHGRGKGVDISHFLHREQLLYIS